MTTHPQEHQKVRGGSKPAESQQDAVKHSRLVGWVRHLVLFVIFYIERWKGIRLKNWAISGRGYIRKEWDYGWEIRLIGPCYYRKSRAYKAHRPFILYKKNGGDNQPQD